jgi:hypothetical protein
LIQTALYAPISSAAGLAFGHGRAGRGGAFQGFAAGAMGAVVGAMLYNLVHTYFFPLEWDFSPLPGTASSRLLVCLSVVLLASICLAAVLAGPAPKGLNSEPHPEDEN